MRKTRTFSSQALGPIAGLHWSAVAAVVYCLLFSILGIWMAVTATAQDFSALVLGPAALGLSLFELVVALNALWLILLIADGARFLWPGQVRPRKAQLVGLSLALVLVVGVFAATFSMRAAALAVQAGS